jgi:hypothetical protein
MALLWWIFLTLETRYTQTLRCLLSGSDLATHALSCLNQRYTLTIESHKVQMLIIFQMVQFKFSAQHDCRMAGCLPSAFRRQMQERQETTRTTQLIAHKDDEHYIINLHALHNATLIRKILPRHLTAPRPLYEDRMARHAEIAAELRVTQAVKRTQTQAKRKATQNAKKAKQLPAAPAGESDEETNSSMDEGEDGPVPEAPMGGMKRRRVV